MQKIPMTAQGYDDLVDQRKKLLDDRPHAVSELKRAREMGDLSENGFYKGARAKLSQVDRQIRHLNHLIRSALVTRTEFKGTVEIGCTVIVNDGEENRKFIIVGSYEADPSQNKISLTSPIGKNLMGRKKGEEISITVPKGEVIYTIMDIKYL